MNITGYSPEQLVWYNDGGIRDGDLVTFQAPIDLVPGRLHHWRVKAINGPRETWAASAFFFTPACASTRSVSINDTSIVEPDAGQANANFTITISPPLTQNGSVFVTTANGSAIDGQDYIGTTGLTVSLPANAASVTLPIAVLGDTLHEADETFTVHLSNPSAGLTLLDAQGIGVIVNDDPMPAIAAGAVAVVEGHTGTVVASIPVTLSTPSGLPVSVDFTTANGSAITPEDYVARTGTVIVPAGSTTATIGITVIGDTSPEGDETFHVDLSSPVNVVITSARGTGTITTDESPWTIVGTGAFNGDSSADILWAHQPTGQHTAWLMNGVAVLPSGDAVTGIPLGPSTGSAGLKVVGTGQFNIIDTQSGIPADTKTDILWTDPATGETSIWLMDGTGVIGSIPTEPSGPSDPSWKAVATGDFNRDGHYDIVWRHWAPGSTFGEVVVWFMSAEVMSHAASLDGDQVGGPPLPDPSWEVAGTGDFNGDGWVDLLFKDGVTNRLVIWIMGPNSGGQDGVRRLAELSVIRADGSEIVAGPYWRIGGTGDFDLDGKIDVLWRNQANGESFVWLLGGIYTAPDVGIPATGILFRSQQMLTPAVIWQ